jgi:hypothetical protein
MYAQPPRDPRAGVALGLAIAALWLGGFVTALATGEATDERTGAVSPNDPTTTTR